MINLTYTFICDNCGLAVCETSSVSEIFEKHYELPFPCLPDGWNRINSAIYCPDENLVVKVVNRRFGNQKTY